MHIGKTHITFLIVPIFADLQNLMWRIGETSRHYYKYARPLAMEMSCTNTTLWDSFSKRPQGTASASMVGNISINLTYSLTQILSSKSTWDNNYNQYLDCFFLRKLSTILNGILNQKLFWPIVKKCSASDQICNFEAEGQEVANIFIFLCSMSFSRSERSEWFANQNDYFFNLLMEVSTLE